MSTSRRFSLPTFSLPGLELARFRRATITRLALLAVVVVPLIYGGLYLSSNHDPVAALGNLRAAVVNSDRPAQVAGVDGTARTIDAGATLVDTLTGPDATAGYSWETATEAQAAQGLQDGEFAAVLRIPSGFSTALASTAGDTPEQARLSVTTDDAQNYILGQVTNTIATSIRSQVSSSTTTDYLENVYVAFGRVHDSLGQAADGADRLTTGAQQADDGAQQLVVGLGDLDAGASRLTDGTGALRTGASDLADGTAQLRAGTAQLPAQTRQLATGASGVADGAARVSAGATALAGAVDQLAAAGRQAAALTPAVGTLLEQARALAAANPDDPTLQQAVTDLEQAAAALDTGTVAQTVAGAQQQVDALATGAAQVSAGAAAVSTGAGQLAGAAPALTSGAARLDDGAKALDTGAAQVDDGAKALGTGAAQARTGAEQLAGGTSSLATGAGQLATSLRQGEGQVPVYTGDAATDRARVVASPVDAQRVKENAVAHYSDGLAPLFVPVSLWVGGMVTFMVLRAVSARALASTASSARAALAGWVPGALLGVLQAVVLMAVLIFAVGIESPDVPATMAFAALVAVVFTAIHQSLNALLGGVGRLVALVLLVLQLTSAGGTYPVGTSPAFFRAIHPYLPMTYAADGLRHLVAGAPTGPVWLDVAVLAGFGVLGLAVTVLACHRRRTWTIAKLHPSLTL